MKTGMSFEIRTRIGADEYRLKGLGKGKKYYDYKLDIGCTYRYAFFGIQHTYKCILIDFGDKPMSKVTAKYQITIPKEIRKTMNIMPGTTIGFEQKAGKFYLVKNNNLNPIDKWRGSLKLKKTTDEIMADLRGYENEGID